MTDHRTIYSAQPSGANARVLATQSHPVPLTRTVLTLPAAAASDVVAGLNHLATNRDALVLEFAQARPGQVCHLRRSLMAAVGDHHTPAASPVGTLAAAVTGASHAQRRAVVDEVGTILTGTQDVPVPVVLRDDLEDEIWRALANSWLDALEDGELLEVVSPHGGDNLLYEGLLADLRSGEPDIDELCDQGWVDVDLNMEAARAWLRHNRPHLTAQLDELLQD